MSQRPRGPGTDDNDERPLALSRQISDQVRSSNRIIGTLRAELADCRRRNAVLAREQQEALRALARLQWIRRQADSAQRAARRGPERETRGPEPAPETEELRRRCGRLERELVAREAEAARARKEAEYLEAMVQELRAIVELLDRELEQSESRGDR